MAEQSTNWFRRLAKIDTLLATTGVRVRELAGEFGVSAKTIRRELDFLHELSPLVYEEEPRGRRRWYYADRRRRVFSKWFAAQRKERRSRK